MNESEPKNDFEKAAEAAPTSLGREIIDLLKNNKKWWLVPILLVLLGVGGLIAVALVSPGAAPFIYTLF
jgi:hypothetical protein